MSASSGIAASDDLVAYFSSAINESTVRFIKIVIRDDSLEHDTSIPIEGTLETDLIKLQDPQILQDTVPAYILARLDEPSFGWLVISYVPESAKIRDKMLYASSRSSLFRTLGSTLFTDTMFATSKDDLTPESYAAHKRHNEAPKPLSSREQELADIRAAENSSLSYQGSRARTSHFETGVGFQWSEEAENAIVILSRRDDCTLAVFQVEPTTETVQLLSFDNISMSELAEPFPPSDPCYAFLAWPHTYTTPPRREIIFIYSCPLRSQIKQRMLYSSGTLSTFRSGKEIILASSPMAYVAPRRIETSDPRELTETFVVHALGLNEEADLTKINKDDVKKPFARPRGPGRKH
ncbi:hypothetical protein AMATHDRAFT_75483 [Amanita thiersii Skay4041]|uniref:ADF-H domain-containing protein n=1 Tax=Amanita thiersii Skay4041 TaxID=703135 RepID=A0A2A9NQU5_9AGAR|nr:hypothetical protein AMATHDRAFT_75483 [Amanita thiersii Skay4041]